MKCANCDRPAICRIRFVWRGRELLDEPYCAAHRDGEQGLAVYGRSTVAAHVHPLDDPKLSDPIGD